MLDVGAQEYGDALLCQAEGVTILVDGAHPGDELSGEGRAGLVDQIAEAFGHPAPFKIDLLIVSHAHQDHIGSLPALVGMGAIQPQVALVADPDLGWGVTIEDRRDRSGGDGRPAVVAGLREERLAPDASDADIGRWLSDAATLEDRYRSMLDALSRSGTTVIRHIRDSHSPVEREFRRIGLRVLGPSEGHVLICAEAVLQNSAILDDRVRAASASDEALSGLDLYRTLLRPAPDSADVADAVRRLGAAVNLQSTVVTFEVDGRRVLLSGDMEFASTDLPDGRLKRSLATMRRRIAQLAPYGFMKLAHHGSANGVDDAMLDQLARDAVAGISAGSRSRNHPSPEVLALLADRSPAVTWVRTDRNGASFVDLSRGGRDAIRVSRGVVNDERAAHDVDRGAVPTVGSSATVPPMRRTTAIPSGTANVSSQRIEIHVSVPADTSARVVTDVERATPTAAAVIALPDPGARSGLNGILLVTSRAALADNIGTAEADRAVATLAADGARSLDLPPGLSVQEAAGAVVERIRTEAPRGILLLGGYDVVASAIIDTLPPDLRRRSQRNDDLDDYIVWSDDLYGDTDGDGLSELPISRIPDARSAPLVATAVAARPSGRSRSAGLRNLARPFADTVYAALPGPAPLLISHPIRPRAPTYPLAGDVIYLMLHGDWEDADRFEGEMPNARYIPAIDVDDVGPADGAAVLAGCCWGALTVDAIARDVLDGRPFATRPPERSMALAYLRSGVQAFVGCTGVHYSPIDPPLFHYGEPMHHYFFDELLRGVQPADALFLAKRRYGQAIPHGPGDLRSRAIEYKIWRQFTCLGIGW